MERLVMLETRDPKDQVEPEEGVALRDPTERLVLVVPKEMLAQE